MKGKSPFRLLLPALALVLTLTAVLAGAASAEGSSVRLVGDKTKFVTDPATTKVLLDNGISPQPVGPTGFQLLQKDEGLSVRYSFPITGGSVNLSALTGAIDHSGGINFVNTNNGKSLLLTNFRIKLGSATLTAEVNGNPAARVAILDLDFSRAKIISQGRHVRVKNVDASLTEAAAGALNASLGVTFFSAGIDLGTAQVFARVAA
ncbi:MAG: HtaA domain-containing protein [Gaiellaceae bacterium]